jgi:hypothetical protein
MMSWLVRWVGLISQQLFLCKIEQRLEAHRSDSEKQEVRHILPAVIEDARDTRQLLFPRDERSMS